VTYSKSRLPGPAVRMFERELARTNLHQGTETVRCEGEATDVHETVDMGDDERRGLVDACRKAP
jgi:hypothetical protein